MFPIGEVKWKGYAEHEGKIYYNRFPVYMVGDYKIHIRLVSVNSPNRQGIALKFCDFKGKVSINGEPLQIPKKKYQDYIMRVPEEDDICGMELELDVHCDKGYLFFKNASTVYGTPTYTTGEYQTNCNAFLLEELGPNHFRFYCNDHEIDEDFDDFVFEMEIIQG